MEFEKATNESEYEDTVDVEFDSLTGGGREEITLTELRKPVYHGILSAFADDIDIQQIVVHSTNLGFVRRYTKRRKGTNAPAVPIGDEKYRSLHAVLMDAFKQASEGKGLERHANDEAFEDQKILKISEWIGSNHGNIFQAVKKSVESVRLPTDMAVRELLGSINYLAAAVIFLRKKEPKVDKPT